MSSGAETSPASANPAATRQPVAADRAGAGPEAVLEVTGLQKYFPIRGGMFFDRKVGAT